MLSTFPSLRRKYSTFRNDLPFFVWQRYFANASLPLATTRSKSNCPIKLICVSQQFVLKALLLMWSSPAALEKVKLSASRTSNGPQSFFSTSQVLYHFRTISSAVVLCPALARALAVTENAAAPTSAQAPASSAFRRDTPILAMSILLFSFVVWPKHTNRLVCKMPNYPYATMRSAPLADARRAKRVQPVHDVSDPRFDHFQILSLLGQPPKTFNHRDQ